MKSYPPFLLLPLMLLILLLQWFWLLDREPDVAPPTEKKTEAKSAPASPAEPVSQAKPDQAKEKKAARE